MIAVLPNMNMSRKFPNRKVKWAENKYRIIEWQQEKRKERMKSKETRLSKDEFLKKWEKENNEAD